jgi:Fe-S-cluster containining protein
MECRAECGACCIAASITSPIPGMPEGKPANTVCVNLDPVDLRCRVWGTEQYPSVCRQFLPSAEVCGTSQEEAMVLIADWEVLTLG